eukprot:scpid93035/ scgid11912/ Gamma-secretase subunit PEN-2; Presenilin enhancer protein 2 homolog
MVNLGKLSKEEKIKICRTYWLVGLALLPLVWIINVVWFFKEAFLRSDYLPEVRSYVIRSLVGAIVYMAGIIAWIAIYQTNRQDWGEAAWKLALVIPNGKI